MSTNPQFQVYGTSYSGNCYKLKLLLTQLQHTFQWHEIDILKGESRTAKFLTMNANGKVPVLQISDDQFIPESNAALFYLAENTPFLSSDPYLKAQTLQWMFFEQYSHEPYIATSRFIVKYLNQREEQADVLQQKREPGYKALHIMEKHLEKNDFFVANNYSIADVALFAYTHVAEDGDFELTRFPNILGWIERIKSQENFIPMI